MQSWTICTKDGENRNVTHINGVWVIIIKTHFSYGNIWAFGLDFMFSTADYGEELR